MSSRGVNKVILVGHLGKDPEVRYSSSGSAIANVTIATSEQWKDKQSGQAQERTEWHNVVFYSRLAEIVGEYLKKGAQIYVEGSLRTRKRRDREGIDRYTTEIIANEMQMLGGRGAGSSSPQPASSAPQGGLDMQGGKTGVEQCREEQSGGGRGFDDFDDDIPFDICQRGTIA